MAEAESDISFGMEKIAKTTRELIVHLADPPDDLTPEQARVSFILVSAAMASLLNTAESLVNRLQYEIKQNEEIKRSMN